MEDFNENEENLLHDAKMLIDPDYKEEFTKLENDIRLQESIFKSIAGETDLN